MLVAPLALAVASAPTPPSSCAVVPVRVGSFDPTRAQLEAAAVSHIIKARGYDVATTIYSEAAAFDALFSGQVDLLASVRLPHGHTQYLEESGRIRGRDYALLGSTSGNAEYRWAASQAAWEAGIRSVSDLHDATKTRGFSLSHTILMSPSDSDAFLTDASLLTMQSINQVRHSVVPSLGDFTAFNFSTVKELYAYASEQMANATNPFIVPLATPSANALSLVGNGNMHLLAYSAFYNAFGVPNVATTITTPTFLASGRMDPVSIGQVAHIYLGEDFVSNADLTYSSNESNIPSTSGPMSADVFTVAKLYLTEHARYAYWNGVYTASTTLITGTAGAPTSGTAWSNNENSGIFIAILVLQALTFTITIGGATVAILAMRGSTSAPQIVMEKPMMSHDSAAANNGL